MHDDDKIRESYQIGFGVNNDVCFCFTSASQSHKKSMRSWWWWWSMQVCSIFEKKLAYAHFFTPTSKMAFILFMTVMSSPLLHFIFNSRMYFLEKTAFSRKTRLQFKVHDKRYETIWLYICIKIRQYVHSMKKP